MKPKSVSIVCAAALAACAALKAANVFPRTAADYHFHRPLLTNGIRGVVMGWPPEYRVIRSEDIDWINEAYAERNAILSGGGTNSTRHLVKAKVRQDDIRTGPQFWNGWHFDNDTFNQGWLDGSVELATRRVLHPNGKTTTNIYTYADTASVTNTGSYYYESYSNATSVITMPFTNGTVSVYSNNWSWWFYDRNTVNVTVTNVHRWTALDWCQQDTSNPFMGNTNAPMPIHGRWDSWSHRFPTVNSISNAYQDLRSTTRLADVGINVYSNASMEVVYEGYNGNIRETTTNSFPYVGYYLSAYTYTNGNTSTSREYTQLTPSTLYVQTRFHSYLNSIGNARRIELEAAFADTYISYRYRNDLDGTSSHVYTNVMLRVNTEPLDTSGEMIRVPIPWNGKTMCSQAAIAAEIDTLPPSSGVHYVPAIGVLQSWELSLYGFVLIYRITPTVKFEDW